MAEQAPNELDEQIIALIEQNGRSSYREIAKQLGISERHAAFRLRRLIADDVIRMITVVDAFAVGLDVVLTVGVQVSDRPAADVAADIARLPNAIAVALMTGPHDIEVMLAFENHAALAQFMKRDIAGIAGARTLNPSLLLDVPKYETGAGPVNLDSAALTIPRNALIDEVDSAIIGRLWLNASETNESIAVTLGLSEATVRKRVNRLCRANLIHITAVRNVAVGEHMVFASIGIEIERERREAIVAALCALRQVHLVANVLGRYDIIAQVLVQNSVELAQFINEVIARIPGVRRTDCSEAMKLVKYDYRWRIVGKPLPALD